MTDREAETQPNNLIPEPVPAAAPSPTVEATFTVEPHPDPVVQQLITEVEELRKSNASLRLQLSAFQESLGIDGSHAR